MTEAVQAVVSSIIVIGASTCSALWCCVCNLKSAQMNVQFSLIEELLFYNFELGHNTVKTSKMVKVQLITVRRDYIYI